MIEIDGSFGEGGGQVLRSSLTLSVLTGHAMRIVNVRAGRKKPGLRPQHLQSVEAAAKISGASVVGAKIGSTQITFQPGDIKPGNYHFDIGTAGSTSLVLQTILLPLCKADRKSMVTVTGGTHVPSSPCFHYLDLHWLHYLRQVGLDIDLRIEQAGFYPQGGGRVRAAIRPIDQTQPLQITKRGKLKQIRGISAVANLPKDIAKRQRQRVVNRLGSKYPLNDIRTVQLPSRFKGTVMLLLAEFEHSQCCYFGLGAPGKRAEFVADEAIDAFDEFMTGDGAIDQFLADQLLLPLAFVPGESTLRTSKVTQHLLTNAEIIKLFLPVEISTEGQLNAPGMVTITTDEHSQVSDT